MLSPHGSLDFYENNLPTRNFCLFPTCVKVSRMLHRVNSTGHVQKF